MEEEKTITLTEGDPKKVEQVEAFWAAQKFVPPGGRKKSAIHSCKNA